MWWTIHPSQQQHHTSHITTTSPPIPMTTPQYITNNTCELHYNLIHAISRIPPLLRTTWSLSRWSPCHILIWCCDVDWCGIIQAGVNVLINNSSTKCWHHKTHLTPFDHLPLKVPHSVLISHYHSYALGVWGVNYLNCWLEVNGVMLKFHTSSLLTFDF